jgi:hypothetical protein
MKTLLLSLLIFFSLTSAAQETLNVKWPEEYKWKTGSAQDNGAVHMVEMVPGNETVDKWTIMGTIMSFKGVKDVSLTLMMNMSFQQAQANAPEAKLTVIEQSDTAKHAWVLFKIESPRFKNDKNPESQLYYMIQGNAALYMVFVAVKEKNLSEAFVNKWSRIFKASELAGQ